MNAEGSNDPAYLDHGDYEVESYGISYTGHEDYTKSLTYSDVNRQYSQVESGSLGLRGLKNADLTTGDYTWDETTSGSLGWTATEGEDFAGAYRLDPDNSPRKMNAHDLWADFSQDAQASVKNTIHDEGNYLSDSFTMTVSDSMSISLTETGTDIEDDYNQHWTITAIESYAETGNYQTGDFRMDVEFHDYGKVDDNTIRN